MRATRGRNAVVAAWAPPCEPKYYASEHEAPHGTQLMKVVYQAQDLSDAQFLVHRLAARGIRTYVRNEALQGALGELPLTLKPEVCVLDAGDFEVARALAEQHDELMRSRTVPPDRLCASCGEASPGNFELCWKCRAPLPEAE